MTTTTDGARSPRDMSALEILRKARAKIASPDNWIKGQYKGSKFVGSKTVVCYCSAGAVREAGMLAPSENYVLAYGLLDEATSSLGIVGFNDLPDTTHEDVLRVFDAAIEKAGALA